MGSIDDSPDGKNIGERYLEHAIEALLGGNALRLLRQFPLVVEYALSGTKEPEGEADQFSENEE